MIITNLKKFILPAIAIIALTSCDHNVSMETNVSADGQLDKIMTFHNKDSSKNILGINSSTGWRRTVNLDASRISGKDTEWDITWTKSFNSASEANEELARPSDTLFRVTSTFEKKFRWFYTYLYYADTYHAINRMKLPVYDYVTPEDYAFIERLPAEGKPISKSDSLYLTQLNTKLFDIYGARAIFEGYFNLHAQMIRANNLDTKWLDTLSNHKEAIFKKLYNDKDLEDDYLLDIMDSLHIPLPYAELKNRYKKIAETTSTTNFISTATEGKYVHRINLPWTVVRTNADSAAGNQLFWKPPVIKFLIKDYTMYGEARQLNVWAVASSVLIVGLTVFVFMRKRST